MTTGGNILALRHQRGMTQKALAEHVGISVYRLSRYENQRGELPEKIVNSMLDLLKPQIDSIQGIRGDRVYLKTTVRGLSAEVEIDDTEMKLTSRQIKWLFDGFSMQVKNIMDVESED